MLLYLTWFVEFCHLQENTTVRNDLPMNNNNIDKHVCCLKGCGLCANMICWAVSFTSKTIHHWGMICQTNNNNIDKHTVISEAAGYVLTWFELCMLQVGEHITKRWLSKWTLNNKLSKNWVCMHLCLNICWSFVPHNRNWATLRWFAKCRNHYN